MVFSVEVKSPILLRSKEKWLTKRQSRQVMWTVSSWSQSLHMLSEGAVTKSCSLISPAKPLVPLPAVPRTELNSLFLFAMLILNWSRSSHLPWAQAVAGAGKLQGWERAAKLFWAGPIYSGLKCLSSTASLPKSGRLGLWLIISLCSLQTSLAVQGSFAGSEGYKGQFIQWET